MARASPLFLTIAVCSVVALWLFLPTTSTRMFTRQGVRLHVGREWSFVREPRFFFVFGDSYSSEGWNWSQMTDPLLPYRIQTNSDGPVWARNLTRRWRESRLVNMAVDGATVDNDVVEDTPLRRLDLQGQVSAFARFFSHNNSAGDGGAALPWGAHDTVASVAFGTNDVKNSFRMADRDMRETYARVGAAYVRALARLHELGVRAFALSLVLPLDGADLGRGTPYERAVHDSSRLFNAIVLRGAVAAWCASHADVLCVLLDTYALADAAMSSPQVYGFTQPHGYCDAYASRKNAEPDLDVHPSCKGPVREYVWRDWIHPAYGFHELWADLYEDTVDLMLS